MNARLCEVSSAAFRVATRVATGVAAGCAVAVALAGCSAAEVVWVPFTSEVAVEVHVDSLEACATRTVPEPEPLRSTVVGGNVGTISIVPQCGPVGTEHQIVVTVGEPWEDVVGRATLEILPGDSVDLDGDGVPDSRGDLLFELERDSAFIGQYGLILQSQGVEGESRVDLFLFSLLEPEELQEVPGTNG